MISKTIIFLLSVLSISANAGILDREIKICRTAFVKLLGEDANMQDLAFVKTIDGTNDAGEPCSLEINYDDKNASLFIKTEPVIWPFNPPLRVDAEKKCEKADSIKGLRSTRESIFMSIRKTTKLSIEKNKETGNLVVEYQVDGRSMKCTGLVK